MNTMARNVGAGDGTPPYVLHSRTGDVVTLSLNRGERFNPLSLAMIAALDASLDSAAADPTVRVVVLRGTGRGFCAGHDLQEMRDFGADDACQRRLFESCNRLMLKLTQMPQPVIARVHGIATAAGCQLVAMCDLAVADEGARFALPGVNIGVFCSTPAVGVVRNVGRKRAMEMLLTGDMIDAATALTWGLVNRVAPSDSLDDVVEGLVQHIVKRSGATIALGKRAFYAQVDAPLAVAYGSAGDAMVNNLKLDDAAEGVQAFLTKRPPTWRNR